MRHTAAAKYVWVRRSLFAFVVLTGLGDAVAQCTNPWSAVTGTDGVLGPGLSEVRAQMSWDPDGPGPAAPLLVVGGKFSIAGAVHASNLATYDPVAGVWAPLGGGVDGGFSGEVYALAALSNGDLVVGGSFTTAGGVAVSNIARWNGSAWAPLGAGTDQRVLALCTAPNGDLLAGGDFTSAGGIAATNVARWNGNAWSAVGPSGPGGSVRALTMLPNGNLVAGGNFTSPAVVQWNGAAWQSLGANQPLPGDVNTLLTLANGQLLAAGGAGMGVAQVQRWDGSAWSRVGMLGTIAAGFYALAELPNGDIVAAGGFTDLPGVGVPCVYRWNGTTWSAVGGAFTPPFDTVRVTSLCVLPNGEFTAGGRFSAANSTTANGIARWNGTAWAPLGAPTGLDFFVSAVAAEPNGDLAVAGLFHRAGGAAVNRLARWSNGAWSPLGAGMVGGGALTVLRNGDLVAAGPDASGTGTPVVQVARWNGVAWTQLGTGVSGSVGPGACVRSIVELANGDIVVGGQFVGAGGVLVSNMARWNGTAWSRFGGIFDGEVEALAVLPDGSIVAGGYFSRIGGVIAADIARWDGAGWSALGTGMSGSPSGPVQALAVGPNGDLFAGGFFQLAGGVPASRIARWNGVAWSALGAGISALDPSTGSVFALRVLPNGDLLVGGQFADAGGVPAHNLARWNGASWAAVGSSSGGGTDGNVWSFAQLPDGDVVAGGAFTSVDGIVSPWLARLTTTCRALVTGSGGGCAGGQLTATLPWAGAAWRADATGLPLAALVFRVTGFATTSLSLASVAPTAWPGCTLHVQPDIVDSVVIANGTASFASSLPNTAALAGVLFHHQMIPIALDGTLAVTATNALSMTVGSF